LRSRRLGGLPTALRLACALLSIGAAMPNVGAATENVAAEGAHRMRATIATEGGLAYFPGLARPVEIDAGALAPADADRLRALVEAARFLALPAQVGQAARGCADLQRHRVTVELDGQRHTVTVVEPIADPALRDLVRFLQQKAVEARRAGAGGTGSR
jgi:hypothetical protein